jgi:hypothetical protein
MHWLWLQKIDPSRPRLKFPIQVHHYVHAFFSLAVTTKVGDGVKTLFCTDRWIHVQRIANLAPRVLGALTGHAWISDIQGALTVIVISECILLWDLLSEVALKPGAEDSNFTFLS